MANTKTVKIGQMIMATYLLHKNLFCFRPHKNAKPKPNSVMAINMAPSVFILII